MPRPTRSSGATSPTTTGPAANAIIASAALMREEPQKLPRNAGASEWQQQAWYFYDTIGEYRFGSTWLAQCVSRAKLKIVEDTDDGGEVDVLEGPEVDALAALFGGENGQPQALAQMALHLAVPGETYIVGEVTDPGMATETETWAIYSNEELQPIASSRAGRNDAENPIRWMLDLGDGFPRELAAEHTVVIRLWRPHPRKHIEADSPTRAALPILREIEQLTKHIAASVDSRLAGAGILFVPSEITFATPVEREQTVTEDGQPVVTVTDVDQFIADLTTAMVTPINDRGHASAVVPIVVKAPGALLANIKHITFSTPLDEKASEQRTTNVGRVAITLDMPPEVMLGLSDANHWSAWQIDEAGIKVSVEPLLQVMTAGLTDRFLYPAVKGQGAEVNLRRRIVADTSDLRTRPDHSSQAVVLYDKGELSAAALRRENGFDEGDAPTGEELGRIMLLRQALGSGSPEVTVTAMHALGQYAVPMPTSGADPSSPDQLEPTVVPGETGDRAIPEDTGMPAPAVAAAADLLCERALERANNRLNNRGRQRRPVPPEQLAEGLRDAWASVPRIAATLGVQPEQLELACDAYCRAVLIEGVAHQPEVLWRSLAAVSARG